MVFKFITDQGGIKRTLGESFDTKYSKLAALKLAEGERLFGVIIEEGLNYPITGINMLPVNMGPTNCPARIPRSCPKSLRGMNWLRPVLRRMPRSRNF